MNRNTYWGIGCALALGSALALNGAASAAPASAQDSVRGVFEAEDTNDTFAIDAFSNRNGGHAGGTIYGQEGDLAEGGIYILEEIVCVAVEGNRATVGAEIVSTNNASTPAGTYEIFSFVDNAASGAPDLGGGGWLGSEFPSCEIDHSDPPAGYTPIGVGDIAITDN